MQMRCFTVLLATAGLVLLLTALALAAERVALVVGNAAYEQEIAALKNPVNDAAAVAAALRRLGFEVIEGRDLNEEDFYDSIIAFDDASRSAKVALFFYAGHGLQVDGRNYLAPVNLRLERKQDLRRHAIELAAVLEVMRSETNLVILDACRNNPLAGELARSLGLNRTAVAGRGLARVESASGTLIAYATEPGAVAADGLEDHSPYTAALLEHLETPGLSVQDLFTQVTASVLERTGEKQKPWTHSSLSKIVRLVPESTSGPTAAAPPGEISESVSERLTAEELAAERVFWESVKDSANAADFEAYLSHYPQGRFALLARNRLAALQQPSTPPELPGLTPESVEAGLELSRADRRLVQLGLAAQGFDPGPADGLIGRGTRGAIGRWQTSRGEASTGYLDAEAAKLLLASGRTREAAEQARRQAEAEAERQRRHQDSQTGARREPKCAELSEDGECWKEIVNQSGCFIWDHLNLNVTVHWSGACNDGVADGEGTLTRETTQDWDWHPIQETGRFVNGKQHGPWASRDAEGDVQEGPYVEGKRHGQWVFRDAEGDVQEGPYVDGKRHGQWAFRDAEGDVQEGPYVDGEKHGNWVESYGSGVHEGPYVNGVKHGRWVERYSYRGNVEEGPYVEGKRHGQWMFRDADGHVYGGSYVNGVKHGRWLDRGSEFLELAFELEESVFGAEEGEGPYVDGKWHGHWMIRNANGDVSEGPL